MMRQFLKALILLPVAIAVVLLAVANRGPVTISFDPFSGGTPEFAATVPLYAALLVALAMGVIVGGVATWLTQAKHRRARRQTHREAQRLRAEAERLRARTGSQLPALSTSGARFP
jgi:uncharacterized integral membrane protein